LIPKTCMFHVNQYSLDSSAMTYVQSTNQSFRTASYKKKSIGYFKACSTLKVEIHDSATRLCTTCRSRAFGLLPTALRIARTSSIHHNNATTLLKYIELIYGNASRCKNLDILFKKTVIFPVSFNRNSNLQWVVLNPFWNTAASSFLCTPTDPQLESLERSILTQVD
jgi:hypothetical protein